MLCDHDGQVVALVRLGGQEVGCGEVPLLAITPGKRAVRDLSYDGLHEPELSALGREPVLLDGDNLLTLQGGQGFVDAGRVGADRGETCLRERCAEHAGVGDDRALARRQGVEPGGDQRLQRRGCTDRGKVELDAVGRYVVPLAGHHRVAVDQRPNGLDGEQRHALGARYEGGPDLRRQPHHEPVDQCRHRRVVERV